MGTGFVDDLKRINLLGCFFYAVLLSVCKWLNVVCLTKTKGLKMVILVFIRIFVMNQINHTSGLICT